MEKGDGVFSRWDKTEKIAALVAVVVFLLVYFSPSAISGRERTALFNFATASYRSVEDSQFIVDAAITLQPRKSGDTNRVACLIQLGISYRGTDTLRGFRWAGKLDEGLLAFTDNYPVQMWLNDPGIDTKYSMLRHCLIGPKYDLLPAGWPKPEQSDPRRIPIPGLYFSYRTALSAPSELGGLDGLIAQLQKPIHLKMIYQGGCEYLQVTPTVSIGEVAPLPGN